MHGYTDCAEGNAYTKWEDVARANGFIILFPQGTEDLPDADDKNPSWNAGYCCGGAMEEDIDDVTFIRQLVEYELERHLQMIDSTRIYLAGHSNGCAMAQV